MVTENKIRLLRNQAGFTLVEMIAAIVLLGIMGLFSTQFITGAAESNRLVSGQKGLVDDAKLAMEFMIREIRVANESTNSISTTATSITFDKYGGLTVDTDSTEISYSLVSGTIRRTSSNATTTLADNVDAFSVAKSGDFYTLSMTLKGANGTNFTLTSGVQPRGSIG